jgi:phage/plasmid-associated DNA primase
LRRLRFLRFDKKPARPDPALKQRIAGERDGIFSMAVVGLRTLLVRQAIPEGGEQSSATRQRFKVQNDPITSFVQGRCILKPAAEALKTDLYGEYVDFLSSNGLPEPQNESTFFRALYNRFQVHEIRRRDGDRQLRKIAGIALGDSTESTESGNN